MIAAEQVRRIRLRSVPSADALVFRGDELAPKADAEIGRRRGLVVFGLACVSL